MSFTIKEMRAAIDEAVIKGQLIPMENIKEFQMFSDHTIVVLNNGTAFRLELLEETAQ
jgi:hypothetical protein